MSVKLLVDFIDGEQRTYECSSDQAYTKVEDGVLRIYDVHYYGASGTLKTSLPIQNIREYRWEGR